MKEKTLLPVAVVALLLLWVGTLGLWAVEAQKTVNDSGLSVSGNQASIEWKLVTTWPKGLPGLGSAPENFARRVGEMSNGRLTVRVYGAGEVVPPFEVFDAVSQGVAEMGHGASYYWKGKIPSSVFYTAVPFGMTAQEMNGWLHYGGGLELWRELYAPFGVRPFAGGSTGVQMAGWFNRELKSASDLDGLKMRIPGLAGEVFAASGGTAVRLAGGEIYTSMQTGVIDAVEWVGPYNDRTLGLMEVAEYYYYPGWHEPGAMLEFTVNQEAFDRLPADLQAIVEGAARATNQDMLDEFTARNNQSLNSLLDDYAVKLRPLPDDVMDVLHSNSVVALEQLKAGDPMAQKIAASYEEFLGGVRRYHEISERAYLNARDRVLPPISFTDQ
ncbi:MAG: TRAP transporter substrate-binding protein [Luminiphilus sp.]|jgi:TRAP-type mannitol/chloroaromatic compound transport system substrate-binding protein|nr:MAG: ABC transporter substrate-binding protein [Halieaceae bacterium MED-G26]|tara:strand:+ start:3141 stop:4295 length:1155 start_codon:yes stop_codon:yes gene_type:complete